MKIEKTTGAPKPRGLFFAALLAVVLALLFWRSFLPGYVHFSNDGPLGQQMTHWSQLPQAFFGTWGDLNDIGADAGSASPDVTAVIHLLLGPVGYAKFLAPITLFLLGIGAWTFFRQLQLSPLAATLGAIATTLDSTFFGDICWGTAQHGIAAGMDFFAMALVVSSLSETSAVIRWTKLLLGGLAVGVNIMEAADIGAILSVLVAAFIFCKSLVDNNGPVWLKAGRGVMRVAVVALFAGFTAFQSVTSLVGTQIHGVVGMSPDTDAAAKVEHWNWATQWSFPKKETLGIVVPGLFGYRYDTPANMMDFLQNSYQGGVYWGLVGCDPSWDSYFAHGETGPEGQGILRWSGGQNYAGILVIMIVLWAITQSLRRQNSVFPENQRRLVWFWAAILVVSLLLAWGRFAMFYQFVYMLPGASFIRNPAKFLGVFGIALAVLFAYGVDALSRRYLGVPATGPLNSWDKLKHWWQKAGRFDRNWTWFSFLLFVVGVMAWGAYASQAPALVQYIQKDGFPDEGTAKQMAAFSIGQVTWFMPFLAVAIGLLVLTLAGVFSGKRARTGGILLGAFLVVDLGRANLPYILHLDYQQKYDLDPANFQNSTLPVINLLRDKPYEHRVAILPFQTPPQLGLLEGLYRSEWMQHHFPYFNIQSLDVVQRPRMPTDIEAYTLALNPRGTPDSVYLIARRWQLTNTRYLLGPAGFLDTLNEKLDPGQRRFHIVQKFNVVPRPGIEQPTRFEEMTAVSDDNGPYALFDFTGALPRAKLYTDWQTNSAADLKNFSTNGLDWLDLRIFGDAGTNGFLTLKKLTAPSFDPQRTVLLDTPLPEINSSTITNQNPGTVEFQSYAPRDLKFTTRSPAPAVLLLNDKYDDNWHVTINGRPATLLRCNFIMRGVFLPPGAHTVEFKFSLPHKPFYVTLTALGVGILLCGLLMIATRRNARLATQP